jgi:hypothetical protein
MILSDLASPAKTSSHTKFGGEGFAQAGSRYPLFGIMLQDRVRQSPASAGLLFGGEPAPP